MCVMCFDTGADAGIGNEGFAPDSCISVRALHRRGAVERFNAFADKAIRGRTNPPRAVAVACAARLTGRERTLYVGAATPRTELQTNVSITEELQIRNQLCRLLKHLICGKVNRAVTPQATAGTGEKYAGSTSKLFRR
jgi:hypothetical protein